MARPAGENARAGQAARRNSGARKRQKRGRYTRRQRIRMSVAGRLAHKVAAKGRPLRVVFVSHDKVTAQMCKALFQRYLQRRHIANFFELHYTATAGKKEAEFAGHMQSADYVVPIPADPFGEVRASLAVSTHKPVVLEPARDFDFHLDFLANIEAFRQNTNKSLLEAILARH